MNYYVLTLFPEMILQAADTSILGRAIRSGRISVNTINIRDFSVNKHNRVDDYPYGGGAGMVMEAEPVCRAIQEAEARIGGSSRVVYLTPQGRVLNQTIVEELAGEKDLILLCGHYEGIDERVLEEKVTDYISIGDYVLTGGELGALVLIDAVSRFVPGVLSNEESSQFESLQDNLLEYPHYTRPEVWRGRQVPKVLLSGDHNKIQEWRLEQSLARTRERRPDLMSRSFPVTGCWFGGEAPGDLAGSLAEAVSRYPGFLELDRKKIRRQGRRFSGRELLLLAVDPKAELPEDGSPFRNLKGQDTPAALFLSGEEDSPGETAKELERRGFKILGEWTGSFGERKEKLRETALEIRKKLEAFQRQRREDAL